MRKKPLRRYTVYLKDYQTDRLEKIMASAQLETVTAAFQYILDNYQNLEDRIGQAVNSFPEIQKSLDMLILIFKNFLNTKPDVRKLDQIIKILQLGFESLSDDVKVKFGIEKILEE